MTKRSPEGPDAQSGKNRYRYGMALRGHAFKPVNEAMRLRNRYRLQMSLNGLNDVSG
jgi:hypothetical protein